MLLKFANLLNGEPSSYIELCANKLIQYFNVLACEHELEY